MSVSSILKQYNFVCDLVYRHRIRESLDIIRLMLRSLSSDTYTYEHSRLMDTYSRYLDGVVLSVDDPDREKVYHSILGGTLELADKVKQSLLLKHSPAIRFRHERMEKRLQEPGTSVEDLLKAATTGPTVEDILLEQEGTEGERSSSEKSLDLIFDVLWLTDRYGERELSLAREALSTPHLDWHHRCVFVSAITLGLLRNFDISRFSLLIQAYRRQEDQISQRALAGLVMALFRHNKRLFLYKDLTDQLDEAYNQHPFSNLAGSIIIQLLKAKDTQRVTRKLEKEIIPELLKLQPRIREKLDLDKILGEQDMEDQNPDWQDFFSDTPGLMDKLQELSNMQMEGNDVFMATFSRLKHFPFFNRTPNWFLPFYTDSPVARQVIEEEKALKSPEKLIESMSISHHMCNSDKYSFCLNLKHMPQQQKEIMGRLLHQEFEQMKEVAEDENLLKEDSNDKAIITQYIQDLYRFFKLHPLHPELDDIFSYRMDFYNKDFYRHIIKDKAITRTIGEYYFSRQHYDRSAEVFEKVLEGSPDDPQEVMEKLAYSYEKLKDYHKAISYYKKAELFDHNRLWNLKKIAFCYRLAKEPEQALEYYRQAETLSPNEVSLKVLLGNTCLELEQYEEAMKQYYNAEQLSNGSHSIWRPLSWCAFVMGNFQQASYYLDGLMEKEPTRYDHMNAGHVALCQNHLKKASEHYVKSIQARGNNIKAFLEAFREDKKHLIKHGVKEKTIAQVLDHVRFQAGKTQ